MGVKLSNGREVAFDWSKVTRAEYRDAMNPRGSLVAEDVLLSKVTGIPIKELESLPYNEWQMLFREAFKARSDIIPNSQSAST